MDTPWKALAPVQPVREYVVLLSYLPLKSFLKLPMFFRYSVQINAQLRATPGVIGYTMRAKLFTRRFWTLSVWDNDKALMEFVAKVPHSEAMKKIAPYMDKTNFWRWKLSSSEIPPRWNDAMRRATKNT
ncbi:MAG: hypothetical protein JO119_16920 [Acidobacteria bacterium]|nr:hypothetical protein [Acidobacteriota bacterium]